MPNYIKDWSGGPGICPGLVGICLGQSSVRSDSSAGLHYLTGFFYEGTIGNPTAPSIGFQWKTFWRFRWAVAAGNRSISVRVKQAANHAPYPKIVLKANPLVGLNADLEQSAGAGADWKTITANFVATAAGGIFVELHNALPDANGLLDPNYLAYFDQLSAT